MISLRCADDCGADIVVQSSNQPIVCFNCGRVWVPKRTGGFQASPPTIIVHPRLPDERAAV